MIDVDRIHHADAFDLFPLIDDESIDLIVCDGPYGVTTGRSGSRRSKPLLRGRSH